MELVESKYNVAANKCCDEIMISFTHLWIKTPLSTKSGISTASHGPRPIAKACATPNLGTFLCQRGWKWSVRHIIPPLYIFAVLPSNSGKQISINVLAIISKLQWGRKKRENNLGLRQDILQEYQSSCRTRTWAPGQILIPISCWHIEVGIELAL